MSTEPVWLRFFRGFFAIALMVMMIFYFRNHFPMVGTGASIAIDVVNGHGYSLSITMCTGNSNAMTIEYTDIKETPNHDIIINYQTLNEKTPCQNFNYSINPTTYNNNINISLSLNNDTNVYNFNPNEPYNNLTIPNNLLLITFNSFLFLNRYGDDQIYINASTSNYIKQFNSDVTLGQTHVSLYSGRAYFIHLNPIISDRFTEDFDNLRNKLYTLELNPQVERLPIRLESNKTSVVIRPFTGPFNLIFERTKKYGLADLISNIGGFYVVISGIFYLLFGMQKHKPWGLVQKYFFSLAPFRRSLKRYFAGKYISSAGIPLVEKVNKRPEGSSLEERVQILESLLQEYYLDDYLLKKVKDVRIKHNKFLKKYNRFYEENMELKNDIDEENTELKNDQDEELV